LKPVRPTSVSVIGWGLVILGAFYAFVTFTTFSDPRVRQMMEHLSTLSVSVQLTMAYVGMGVTIVCGFAMLKGRNWARILYLSWTLVGLAVGFMTTKDPIAFLPGLVVFLIVALFLFRPSANAYFLGKALPPSERQWSK
jgi:hypothetical protein